MSTWQVEFRVQLVSADVAPWQGDAVKQNWTLVMGSLAAGAYVGTGWRAPPTGDGVTLGEVLGDVFGDVPGEVTPTLLFDPPRLATKMPPTMPSRSKTTIAATAGTSQGGRSVA